MSDPRDPLAEAFRDAARDARVPSSGLMWWRIQLRARREAETSAVRVVSRVQWMVPSLVVAVGVVALATSGGFSSLPIRWGMPLLVAAVAGLVLMPVVLWLALARK